ncbi:MAG: NAD-dependent epimerase/dehydratase family protein [Pseudomonadota bacterium]
MRIAITGSTGFVGSAVTAAAATRGHEIVRVLRVGSTITGRDDVCVDLEDLDGLAKMAAGVDAVVHCAASDNPDFVPISRAAAETMLAALPAAGRFVMQGGSVVFGDTGIDAAENPEFADIPQLSSRIDFEKSVLSADSGETLTRIVYGSMVYGGPGAAIPAMLMKVAIQHEAALYFGDGDQVWSTVHVQDFGSLLIDAAENTDVGNAKLFAATRPVQLRPVASLIGSVLGLSSRAVATEEEEESFGPFRQAMQMNQHYDSSPTRKQFGWRPYRSDEAGEFLACLTHQASHANL